LLRKTTSLEQLAKKYGYANRQRIDEYIAIYKNREEILKRTPGSTVSFKKALKVLRELKQKEKGKLEGNNWR
jgi:acetyl-CoA carboxylase carboxyltransferase component